MLGFRGSATGGGPPLEDTDHLSGHVTDGRLRHMCSLRMDTFMHATVTSAHQDVNAGLPEIPGFGTFGHGVR